MIKYSTCHVSDADGQKADVLKVAAAQDVTLMEIRFHTNHFTVEWDCVKTPLVANEAVSQTCRVGYDNFEM